MVLSDRTKDRIRGCIYGQAIGDALGLGTEFMSQDEVRKYYPSGLAHYDQIIQDAHRSRWKKECRTDDTYMMICIAKARLNNHFDLNKIACNFKEWFSGTPMVGIGRHSFNVLAMRDYTENPIKAADIIWRMGKCRSAANGGIMRTSIVATENLQDKQMIEEIYEDTISDLAG